MITIDGKTYYRDGQGRLVPEDLVADIDKARDALVRELCEGAKARRAELKSFREWAMGEIMAFLELAFEKHNVRFGGLKGNVTLPTFGGEGRIQIAVAERMDVNEGIHVAEQMVVDCVKTWSEGSRPELLVLVQDAFRVDKKGQINVRNLVSLRRIKIENETWKRAMDAIADALFPAGSKQYVRFYERAEDGQYKAISLDFAAM